MKKFLSIMLAFVLAFSMGIVAFADEVDTNVDMSTITLTKDYVLENPDTISPAETFTFSIERTSVTDAAADVTKDNMPIPTIGSVQYSEGEAGSATMSKDITITLPTYDSVGIYTYTINEDAGDNAGVTYREDPIKLVVTVQQGADDKIRVAAVHTENGNGEKTNKFENKYSAGSLSISKTVTGNMGDRDKYFKVTVTLTGESGKTYAGSYDITGGSPTYTIDGSTVENNPTTIAVGTPVNIYLKHDDTVTISNLPYGVSYTVAEDDYTSEGYGASYVLSDDTKVIKTANSTVAITNNKEAEVDTGITLDNVPYILLLACVFVGMVLFFAKKRLARED